MTARSSLKAGKNLTADIRFSVFCMIALSDNEDPDLPAEPA